MEQQPHLNDHNKQEYPPMHTTEHIINQTMVRLFGCGRSISAHIERKKSKLDYRLAACPTEEEIKKLEEAVNEVIARQLPVTTEFITQEEAQGRFDLERLPDGASETVRVVKEAITTNASASEYMWRIHQKSEPSKSSVTIGTKKPSVGECVLN